MSISLPKRPTDKAVATPAKTSPAPAQTKEKAQSGVGDTANNDDILARATARRRIDATAIAGIAKLVAKNLTESEACRRLGIQPRVWFNFKERAGRGEKFAALLEAYRAHRIEHLIEQIEKSADGIGVKYPDFRAALALLKITDQKRFGDAPAVEAPPLPVVSVTIMSAAAKQIYDDVVTLPATLPALPPPAPVALPLPSCIDLSKPAPEIDPNGGFKTGG